MKQYVLHDELKPHMWAGVIIIALAVCLVGASPMIDEKEEGEEEGGGSDDQFALGLFLTIGGTFMQSLQYVYEEKMMSGDTKVRPRARARARVRVRARVSGPSGEGWARAQCATRG